MDRWAGARQCVVSGQALGGAPYWPPEMGSLAVVLLTLALTPADAGPSGGGVFRTEAQPRVDPVFGGVAALRTTIDQFLALETEMTHVREQCSSAVHRTLEELATIGARKEHSPGCTPAALTSYSEALDAGRRYLGLGRRLEARFQDIRRADDLGDTAALTPDYRWKTKRARELYASVLRDYHEMRVAFHEQLGAELRFAGCKLPTAGPTLEPHPQQPPEPDPAKPEDWELAPADQPQLAAADPPLRGSRPPKHPAEGAGPAIWIEIDNTRCAAPSRLTLDGEAVGDIAAGKKVSVRTHAGPHALCVLPASDKRTCGGAGTVRRAYLYEGWALSVRCGK